MGFGHLTKPNLTRMIFVTGGTGFVGAHLLRHLVYSHGKVLALKRTNSNTEYTRQVFQTYSDDPPNLFNQVEWVEGDVLDYDSLLEATPQVDTIYHAAAMVSFDPSSRQSMLETNIRGTANVVNVALEHGIDRIAYISSVAALDPAKEDREVNELQFGNNPARYSAYAESKFQGELEIWRGVEEGLKAVVVNPSIIIGPLAPEDGPGGFFQSIRKGMVFYPMGVTGFVDVRDVCRSVLELMDRGIYNERFILSQDNHSYRHIFQTIARAFNTRVPGKRIPPFATALAWRLEWMRSKLFNGKARITREIHESAHRQVHFSNEKIRNAIDFQFIPIEQSIQDTVEYFEYR